MTRLAEPVFAAPTADAVMARAAGENFPVASRVLPAAVRSHLLAVYGFARLVDELGDCAPGDRLAALDWLEGELDLVFAGQARHPLMVRLQDTVAERGLSRGPFARLIEANRLDQRRNRYETWEDLRHYCSLSADPVGELVLGIFGQADVGRVRLSDRICTALQLVEHCQDVAEDMAAGRIYMPLQDMARFGVGEAELADDVASAPLRALVAFEVERAHGLLREGMPLIGSLHGRARIAVAAFAAGGSAALQAIERAGYDVLAAPPKAGSAQRLLVLGRLLTDRRAWRR